MTIEAPLLAAITMDQTGGGIAAVSSLLWRVFQEKWGGQAQLLTMFSHQSRPATFIEKTRYAMALASVEALRRTDWIFFSHLGLAIPQRTIPERMRRPYGVFLHGIEAWGPLEQRALDALAGASLRIANSRFTARRIGAMHPTVGPIEVCPLSLSEKPQTPNRECSSNDPALGSHAVIVVGRMAHAERYKGHDQLIEAWPSVLSRIPDAKLIVVGDGDDRERLMNKASASGAGSQIEFLGYVGADRLDALYRGAALFALPSRGEGFGLVYLEAMSRGLACVGSIHDAACEVIADGVTGRLVDQNDVAGLAGVITSLLLDPSLRRQMGDAGTRRAQTEFTFERFRDRMFELLPARSAAEAPALA